MSSLSLLYGSDVALLSFWKKRKKEAKIGEKGQKEQKCEDRQNSKEGRRDTEEWKKEKDNIRQGIGQSPKQTERGKKDTQTVGNTNISGIWGFVSTYTVDSTSDLPSFTLRTNLNYFFDGGEGGGGVGCWFGGWSRISTGGPQRVENSGKMNLIFQVPIKSLLKKQFQIQKIL